ncbi:HNH endonuclease [Streptomyces sp. ISL-12]|uniref:HNH endonuclease n=1 Tax=Streptomyces sp. ISL-12 TaxID=2819177 RepID=UPI0035AC153E
MHRAVCEAFHGPPPSTAHQAAHLDGNPANNAASNLAWATPSENAAHCAEHGTAQRGALHYASKVTERDVRVIRRARRLGISPARLAARFGIHRATVGNIAAGRTWAHVGE